MMASQFNMGIMMQQAKEIVGSFSANPGNIDKLNELLSTQRLNWYIDSLIDIFYTSLQANLPSREYWLNVQQNIHNYKFIVQVICNIHAIFDYGYNIYYTLEKYTHKKFQKYAVKFFTYLEMKGGDIKSISKAYLIKNFEIFENACSPIDSFKVSISMNDSNTNSQIAMLQKMGIDISQECIEISTTSFTEKLQNCCKDDFEHRYFIPGLQWASELIGTWLKDNGVYHLWERIERCLQIELSKYYINQIFDIIKACPDSQPIIEDFKFALEATKLHQELANKMIESYSKRLLIPGVISSVIILQYIQIIKVLKYIDSSTILLDIVSDPIKACLRKRPDTLRSIISSIRSGEGGLNDALNNGKQYVRVPLKENNDADDYISSEEDEACAEKWEPFPRNKSQRIVTQKNKNSDILSTLVNIYGSEEKLLSEYKGMLSERLLFTDCNKQNETTHLELLKKRFGEEQQLQQCDVMLMDITQSQRVWKIISEKMHTSEPCKNISFLQISKEYWPLQKEQPNIKLPAEVMEAFEKFKEEFGETKKLRKVELLPQYGIVELTLEFSNGSKDFKVSPITAAIIDLFNKNNTWSIEGIANELEMPARELKSKIGFWVNAGVLIESTMKAKSQSKTKDVKDIVYTAVDTIDLDCRICKEEMIAQLEETNADQLQSE